MSALYQEEHQRKGLNVTLTTINTRFDCGVCSGNFPLGDLFFTTVDLKLTPCCQSCQDADFGACGSCAKRTAKNNIEVIVLKSHETIEVCSDCKKSKLAPCRGCEEIEYKHLLKTVGRHELCRSCESEFSHCEKCENLCQNALLTDNCCSYCMANMVRSYYTKVEGVLSDPFMRDDDGRKVFYNKGVPGHAVLPRGSNPPVITNASKQGAERFFGIELEVELNYDFDLTRDRVAKRVHDCFPNPFIICKHDGSLKDGGNGGFEIVSAPATYKRHLKEWEMFFSEFQEKGLLSSFFTQNCGMHIHVSRASLSSLQIGKIVNFITHPNNRKFIRTIAQRGSNRYNNYTKAKRVSDVPFMSKRKGRVVYPPWIHAEGHYTAVNLSGDNTIEIRIFKGTLKKESFFKNIEFVSALVDFCETGVASVKDMGDASKFCSFVEKFSGQYPYLFAFLVERELCKPKGKLIEKRRRRRRRKKAVCKSIPEAPAPAPAPPPAPVAPVESAAADTVNFSALPEEYTFVPAPPPVASRPLPLNVFRFTVPTRSPAPAPPPRFDSRRNPSGIASDFICVVNDSVCYLRGIDINPINLSGPQVQSHSDGSINSNE